MDKELRENLQYGDKITIVEDGLLGWMTGNPDMLKFAGKEVTFVRSSGSEIKIKEDDEYWWWSSSMFKNVINGVDYDAVKPKFTKKKNFKIEFDSAKFRGDSFLKDYYLVEITSSLDELKRYNSERFSKVVAGKWVVLSKATGRIYADYNPHLMMVENRVKDYRLDDFNRLIIAQVEMFNDDDVFKKATIDFKNGKFKVHKMKGNVCQCCGRDINSWNSIGCFCHNCITNRKLLTHRFYYHDYGDGYPTPAKVDTTKVPVFGCEIERDYEEPPRDFDDCDEDEYEDEYASREDFFNENLDSATFDIVKIMQEDQFKKGILKRENVFMCDGSLNYDGLEWITFPHTFSWYVKNKDKFNKALNRIEDYGFTNTDSVGNHIHMNRDFFTINGRDCSDFCASKIAILFSKYWNSFRAIAKRYNTDYSEKPKCNHDDSLTEIINDVMCYKREHCASVNLQHNDTIEIRLWSGINSGDDLIFFLDNMQALARYAKRVSIERVQTAKITDFMKYYKLDTTAKEALKRIKNWRHSVESGVINDIEKFIETKEAQQ